MAETTPTPPPALRRSFGLGALAAAVAASALLAGGATWLLVGRGGHDHAPADAAGPAKEQWQCPMHPTIVTDHPADCPICGMKLVKVGGAGGSAAGAGPAEARPEEWQCPMHPSIVEHQPGDCPICGMKLVKVPGSGPLPAGLAAITIDPARQQLIGLRIAHVERGPIGGLWRTNGRIAVDETRVHHVNVKFNGYMDRVFADFVGKPIRRGEPLFSIYSPELLSAQEEFLLALRTRTTLGGGMAGDGEALVKAARRKLELWDVPPSEIDRIERAGEASRTVTFFSPASGVLTKKDVVPGMKVAAGDMPFEIVDLSHVWGLADAYETDLRHVRIGMKATLTLKAFPGRTFEGRVAFIDPLLDPRTRTAKVRIDFPNPGGELRPELFGEVVLQGKAREGLRIPADAVIDSGTAHVVFVALPDGKFSPRAVELGDGDGAFAEVMAGLAEGEGVVTRANFLVDSESRLRASLDALQTGAPPTPTAPATTPADAPSPAAAPTPAADPHAGHRR